MGTLFRNASDEVRQREILKTNIKDCNKVIMLYLSLPLDLTACHKQHSKLSWIKDLFTLISGGHTEADRFNTKVNPHLTEGNNGQLVERPAIPGVHLEGHLVPSANQASLKKSIGNEQQNILKW